MNFMRLNLMNFTLLNDNKEVFKKNIDFLVLFMFMMLKSKLRSMFYQKQLRKFQIVNALHQD
jgi:hypothetical protein